MVAMSRFASELIDFAPRQSGCKITAGERSGEQMREKRREVGGPPMGHWVTFSQFPRLTD